MFRLARTAAVISLALALLGVEARAQDLGPTLLAVGPSPARNAQAHDALTVARAIARRVRTFRAFRAEASHGVFRREQGAVWRIRPAERCLASLAAQRVRAEPLARELTTPVPTPVVLRGAVGGVSFVPVQRDRQIELSCELASRLPALAAILRAHGVRRVHVNSSYRDQPYVSFHTFGLALDIAAFETTSGVLSVARDYELSSERPTCEAEPSSPAGKRLQRLACDLAASGLFSTVITPNYNEGHRDHFHLDIRPNDPALFVR